MADKTIAELHAELLKLPDLPVEWRTHLIARREELVEMCCSVSLTDQERRDATMRLDELRRVIDLPDDVARRALMLRHNTGAEDGR